MFKPETYIQRRQLLKKSVGSGLLIFPGNEESPMNYPANTYHFRQDSTFPISSAWIRPRWRPPWTSTRTRTSSSGTTSASRTSSGWGTCPR